MLWLRSTVRLMQKRRRNCLGIYIFIEMLALGAVLTGWDEFKDEKYLLGFLYNGIGAFLLFFGLAGILRYINKNNPKSKIPNLSGTWQRISEIDPLIMPITQIGEHIKSEFQSAHIEHQ